MSLLLILLALTSAFCVVTSQEQGEGHTMASGADTTPKPDHEIEGVEPTAGKMRKFTPQEVQNMIDGMKNGFRYKYDGTVSTHEDDITISMEQLIAMKAQLEGTGPTGSQQKQFTVDEVRMMIDGMNNGLRYNRQGQVSTVTEEIVFTVVELQHLMTELQTQEQVFHQFSLDDLRRMVQGMETGGLQYNYQGQIAQEGQPTISLPQLKEYVQKQEAQAGPTAPSDVPIMPDVGPGQDLGLKSIGQFTLDQIRNMIAGMESGVHYNYQGQPASQGQRTLTMGQLQRFLNEILSKGTTPTADFTRSDLERMLQGINNGLEYNYQGQLATPGQAILTRERIQELLAKLDAKGPMNGAQLPTFVVADVERMLQGMDRGIQYNYQGLEATPGEPVLTREYLSTLLKQLDPQRSMGEFIQTAQFTMDDINRMLTGMDNGLNYNYQGQEAAPGEPRLTRDQLRQFEADLRAKGMGGLIQTPQFTMDDISRMLTGMDNGLYYNYQGQEAAPGEPRLTRDQLRQLEADLKAKGMGEFIQTAQFTMDDINRMLTGMDNGLYYNYQGQEAAPGEPRLTRDQLRQFEADLRAKGMGGLIQTPQFTIDDINRMLTGMDNGLYYNYQGQEAAPGEPRLTRDQLRQLEADLKAKGMGEFLQTAQFTMDDINRMLTGMDNGLYYNYQGQEAAPGEPRLTRDQLRQFEADLRAKGMGGDQHLQPATFTLDDIFRMLAGMDSGILYNYQGVEAKPGEKTLTREQLENIMSTLKSKEMGGPLKSAAFTVDDIGRMRTGMESGINYNLQGAVAQPGEKTLTTQDLDNYLAYINSKDTQGGSVQPADFTISDVERMLAGIREGREYNYQGLPATAGDPVLSLNQLNEIYDRLRNASGIEGTLTVESSAFSESTNETRSGQISGQTFESSFTSEQSNSQSSSVSESVISFGSSGGEASNVVDINLLAKENPGKFENKNAGFTGVIQEATPTDKEKRLQSATTSKEAASSQGKRNTLKTSGKTAEGKKSMDVITKIKGVSSVQIGDLADKIGVVNIILNGKPGQGQKTNGTKAKATKTKQTSAEARSKETRQTVLFTNRTRTDVEISRSVTTTFTIEEINRMKEGINQGLSYNLQGLPAQQGEELMTLEMLNNYAAGLNFKDPQNDFARFTRNDIDRMVEGIERGESFNYRGLPPSPGEKTLTIEDLNRLRADIDSRGTNGTFNETTRFSVSDLERMIAGMRNGEQFNYDGLPAAVGDPVLSIDELYSVLNKLQAASGLGASVESLASMFTRDEVSRMIDGIRRGESYNYQGLSPSPGEKTLTIEDLNRLIEYYDSRDTTMATLASRFTRDEVNTMIAGIRRGESYNYQGLAPSPGEKTFTLEELNRLLSYLDSQAPMLRFSREDINRMIEGIRNGYSYNYQGLPPAPGEKTMSLEELTRLLDRMNVNLTLVGADTAKFTLDDLERMLAGMDNGLSYNYQGQEASPGESTLSRAQLETFYATLKGGQTTIIMANITTDSNTTRYSLNNTRFTLEDLRRFLEGMNQGQEYNYQGKIATAGEPTISRQQLERRIRFLENIRTLTRTFTLEEIQRMLDGIDAGKTYNYQGQEAAPGESTLTRDELTVHMLDLLASRFNRDDINRMLAGLDRGEVYNYKGQPALTGERTLTREQLNRILSNINTSVTHTRTFTLEEIQRMLDGIDRGKTYNYRGQEAVPGESTLTRDELTVHLLELLALRFNRDDINRMLAGTDRGEVYNYQGQPASIGERTLTREELKRILSNIDSAGTVYRTFSLEEIQRLLDGLDAGKAYNHQGQEAAPGEPTLTRDELTVHLLELLASRFKRDDINRMLAGLDRGEVYNYQGQPALTGERTLTREELNRILSNINAATTTTFKRRDFTIEEIQRMLDGMNNGLTYNYQGEKATPGERIFNRNDLTIFLLDLLATRFNRDDVNNILAGIDRGEAYNFEGRPARTGEPILDREILTRLLPVLEMTNSTRNFTIDEILTMLDGIERGLKYNYEGRESTSGEPTLNRDELLLLLFKLLATRYNVDNVYSMLADMDTGLKYTYDGQIANEGERSWDRRLLEELLIYLLRKRYGNVALQKPAEISSTFDPIWTADKGVDGNRNGNVSKDSCFHTLEERDPYFIVDLEREHSLNSLVMYNRIDCCSDRAVNLFISTGNSKDNMTVQNVVVGPIGDRYALSFTPNTNARFVKIQSRHNDSLPLHLCEVEIYGTPIDKAYTNVALNKSAEISSNFNPRWTADKGVDGYTSQNINDDRCFHTDNETRPYFIVDLGAVYNIKSVYIYNRQDCCDDRASNIEISTGLIPNVLEPREFIAGPLASETSIPFNKSVEARFVKIQVMDSQPTYLHLCEVEVYGEYVRETSPNVALYKTAETSSAFNPRWTADKGVDGSLSQNMSDDTCFHTNNETEPYFIVNLGSVYDISNIFIYNRQDCCEDRASNIEISTGLTRDGFIPQEFITGPLSSVTNIPMTRPTHAQYVKIQSKDLDPTYLHLCEVEVYGDFVRDDSCVGIYPPCQNGGHCTNLGGEYNCICTGNWTGPNCSEPVRECFHNGVVYYDGEIFKDDCNTCICMNGFAACTRMACPGRPCLHNNVFYRHGDRFKDDCNECICNNGRVSCTLEDCPNPCYYNGTRYAHGEIFNYECNTCRCIDGHSICTQRSCVNLPCYHKGRFYRHESSFKDDCNTCTCYNGTAACTLMACRRRCLYNGLEYPDGSSFKDDCNTCQCNDGTAVCTQIACGKSCIVDGIEHADGEFFKDDCNNCTCEDGIAACTKMACGGYCRYKGVGYFEGEQFKDDCNNCTCSGGKVSCTYMMCPGRKPGFCPRFPGAGICIDYCRDDSDCPGIRKCCSNGCGYMCMMPEFEGEPCYHYGVRYANGESFKDDCNTCRCVNGTAACTRMGCPPRENIAFRKDAEMSSYFNNRWTPDKAVDGDTSSNINLDSCFHTLEEPNPYWRVDLGAVYDVDQIEVYNRGDCCADRLTNLEISTGLTRDALIDQRFIDGPLPEMTKIPLSPPVRARFIELQKRNNTPSYFHICEVVVYGDYVGAGALSCFHKGVNYSHGETFKDDCNNCTCMNGTAACTLMACSGSCYHYGIEYADGESFKDDCNTCRCSNGKAACTRMACPPRENIAFRKDAGMSSYFNNRWTPDKAVDGDTSSNINLDSCFHTLEEPNPYWRVDLGAVYDVDQIEVYNRGDCCADRLTNLEISTGLTRDALIDQRFIDGPLPEMTKIPLSPPVRARFIELQKRNNTPSYFHICEVVVYGDYVGAGALSCFHKGVNYSHGETFKDDCNNCTCMDGTAACTLMACRGSCYHYGIEYADGESFKDDCNTCRCSNGKAACTRMACPPRENIAFRKDAEMSSYFNNRWTPDKAVDGDTSSNINLDSCFHTLEEPNPYWRVDLGAVYDVDQIEVYNRGDCCADRLTNLEISTGLTRDALIDQRFIDGPLPEMTKIPLSPPVRARFIELQKRNNTPSYFHICEVVVYGDYVGAGARSCFHKGVNYSHGETFKDDCNNCTCMDGTAACTLMACSGSCYHYGIEYADGESFKDDCNTCRCSNGKAACTRMACPPRENIAFRKDAEMSSYFNNRWTPDKAVDGDTSSNINLDSCFHTLEEPNPYWRVNLGAVYDVDQIEVYNRGDCCDDRLKNLAISTGLTRDDLVQQRFIEGPLPEMTKISLSPDVRTQFIELQIRNDTPSFFHICEVIVYGDFVRDDLCSMSPCLNGGTCTNNLGTDLCICTREWTGSHCHISTQNIAYNKPTELSSLYKKDPRYSGDKAVDGDTNGDMSHGSCFHTEMEREPYWMVDLGGVYELQKIVLHNRQDSGMEQARDIEILAGLTKENLERVYYHAGELGPMRSIPIVSGTEAQYILVHNKNLRPSFLHLCEVEVFGVFVRNDLCKNNPCRNGGTCTNRARGAICSCPQGYGGIHCRDSLIRPTPPPGVTDIPEPDWNGSRIDPAVCRRAQCNLPICYVPYPNDCAKYVVCQRTAIGTYVAWKMRCAFGSYWGTGRTYTCERVEDLAKQGYVCPNDRCANTSLITYPDEDVSNCRTYWRCDNGISRPACCPPGQAFNRNSLQCESDPHEYCRSPCPLKIDGCVEPGSHTEPFYDGNCRTYWNCRRGHSHPVCCKPGMSYDFVLGRCKEDTSCTDPCPPEYDTNLCTGVNGVNQTGSYTLADGNCRTYMKCRADGYDDPFCCLQDYFYNANTARCELLEDENDLCRYEVCPRGYKEECRFTAIPDSPKQFYDGYAKIVKDCAPGTTFAPDICTCDGSSLINVCKAEVWAKFDQLDDKWSVKNYGDGWISVFGDMSKNRTAHGITYATFDGSSGMEVWRYDHTALPAVTLEITFEPVVGGVDRQILVSNCMSVDNGDASFEVSLDPRNAQIIFKGKSKFDSVELSLPYNRQGWNTFKLFFDGEHLVAVVEDPSGKDKTTIRGENLRGAITAGVGAMKFGPCLDSFSMPKNNGFTGFVSEVIFSKCIDDNGRDFINQHLVPEERRTQAEN